MRPLRLDGPTKLSDSLMRLNVSGSVFVVPRETLTRHDPGSVFAEELQKKRQKDQKLQEKRDAAYAATSAKSKKETQKEKDKKRQAKARQIKALVGDDIWHGYFKFTTERNPWDRQVSNYFHRQSRRDTKADFERYLTSPLYHRLHHVRLDNWGIYTIDDEIVVDAVIRYENLAADTLTVLQKLGLASEVEIPFARAGHRPDRSTYRKYYSDRTIEVVRRWYANEIDAFGYAF